MNKELKFVFYSIKKNIQNSAELRTSFLMNIFGMMLNNVSLIIIWVFFVKSVGNIGGWTAYDIIALQGFVALSFGISHSMFSGIEQLADYVAAGSFDKFMLTPKNLLLRVSTSAFGVSAVGDIFFGIICLTIYGVLIHASILQILFILLLVLITAIMFFSMSVFISSLSFYFTDSSPVVRGTFDLFLTPSIFHGGSFQGVTRAIFTFVIPSLLIGALPVEAVKDTSFSKLAIILGITLIWFFISIKFFKKSVRRYESANFMTFGQ